MNIVFSTHYHFGSKDMDSLANLGIFLGGLGFLLGGCGLMWFISEWTKKK